MALVKFTESESSFEVILLSVSIHITDYVHVYHNSN